MERWRQDIDQILKEEEARGLAGFLIAWTRHITAPGEDVRQALEAILQDVAEELPVHRAMWVAFYLGAAWQKGASTE